MTPLNPVVALYAICAGSIFLFLIFSMIIGALAYRAPYRPDLDRAEREAEHHGR